MIKNEVNMELWDKSKWIATQNIDSQWIKHYKQRTKSLKKEKVQFSTLIFRYIFMYSEKKELNTIKK